MKCTSLLLKGREICELYYEELRLLFDQQLPPLETVYAFFVIRDVSWKYPSPWNTEVYQIVPMEPLIVDEKDAEFQWLFILQSATERLKLHVLVQTDSSNPSCYTYFIDSLRLIFSEQGSPVQAARCIQQLKELLERLDIPLEKVHCTVEGWTEDTRFYALVEHDIGKLKWNAALDQFMHPLEE